MDKFDLDFDFFWDLIDRGINFTFTRYADGEVMLMRGEEVNAATQAARVDNWMAPAKLTRVGRELLTTLNHKESNYYYGISGKNDNVEDFLFLINNIKQTGDTISFVNLWINANYNRMLKKICSLKRKVVLICNEIAEIDNIPFPVSDLIRFPNSCIDFWETNADEYTSMLIDKVGNLEDQLFFISCGPVSEIIIHRLYENNPKNTYVDVGSSIDFFVHGRETRPYMNSNSEYSKAKSIF